MSFSIPLWYKGNMENVFTRADRLFDQIGLWVLAFLSSFLASGLLLPFFLPCNNGGSYPFVMVILGTISAIATLAAVSFWHLATKFKITGTLRLIIALWLPFLVSLPWQSLPGCFMTPSKSFSDYLSYIFACLVLPSLIGAAAGLLGIHFHFKLFGRNVKNECSV